MKSIFLTLVLLFTGQAFAAETLLHCDVTWTDLKTVKIEKRDSLYVLIEEKLQNRVEEKAISEREYKSNDYRLSNYAFYFRRLEKHNGDWFLRIYNSEEEQVGRVTCTE